MEATGRGYEWRLQVKPIVGGYRWRLQVEATGGGYMWRLRVESIGFGPCLASSNNLGVR